MKYFWCALGIIGIVLFFLFFPLNSKPQEEYFRIHIRANSNSVIDQNVKYKVKDEVIESLSQILSSTETIYEIKKRVKQNYYLIESIADKVLAENGVSYRSHANIKNEFFTTKTYQGVTLKEGCYDSLIIDLGSGEGNNWWCIIFPTFCITQNQKSDKVEYISLIWEIIKDIT